MAIFVALALSASICNAQEVIELKEAKVEYRPVSKQITNKGNTFLVHINEVYNREFTKDPIAFMKTHFNIKEVIAEMGVEEYDTYNVSFKSRKGVLVADFDANGEILWSALRFRNVAVPSELQHQIYRDFKGWAMVKSLHVASESEGRTIKDFYKVTLKKGNQRMKFKIDSADIGKSTLVAVN